MVFITAGMGGGTGTGGASVVAQIARELGALTVAVVTKPFSFEGKRRRRHGEAGISRLRECVDTLITIPNQRLLTLASPDLAMVDAFKIADAVLVNAVKGISEIINTPGIVNVDFADVKAVMSCMGQALMGIGLASGEKRAIEAARQAIRSPLLEDVDIEGATGILINIAAGADVKMMEINEACMLVQEAAHEDANIIFGAVIDEELGDQIRVTVIATGFPVDATEDDVPDSNKIYSNSAVSPHSNRLTANNAGILHKPTPPSSGAPKADSSQTPIQKPEQPMNPVSQIPENKAQAESLRQHFHEPEVSADPSTTWIAPQPSDLSIDYAEPQSAGIPSEPAVMTSPTQKSEESGFLNSVAAESAHLARLTLDSGTLDALCLTDDFPSLVSINEPKVETRFEGAIAINDPKDEILSDISAHESARIGASIFDTTTCTTESQDNHVTAGTTLTENPPLEGLFDKDAALLAGDIDRRIDEALELAERINSPEIKRDEDDLDVPAFIRSNLKDLSLT